MCMIYNEIGVYCISVYEYNVLIIYTSTVTGTWPHEVERCVSAFMIDENNHYYNTNSIELFGSLNTF